MNNKNNSVLLCLLVLFTGQTLFAQFKYWVRFTDKTGTPYSLSNPSAFLTQKSIDRRISYNIALDATDLPVNPAYISQIENVPDVTVLYASKWLNGVVVSVPSRSQAVIALTTIETFSFVVDTSKVKRYNITFNDPVKTNLQSETPAHRTSSKTSGTYDYGGSYWQNKQLNVISFHENGYRGQGMTIAVLDAGFSNVNTYHVFDSLRDRGGIIGTRNFADGGTDVYVGSTHGTMVLSCIAGNKPGRILGSAPLANFWLMRTEEAQETISEEYNWIRGAEFADSVGVDILTTSLGYTDFDDPKMNHTYSTLTGRKAPMSIAANMAARKGMFVLNAAGNEGAASFHYISVPGDADSICTVGAVDSLDRVAAFSSVGPTFDGRIKPDLVARGVGSWVSDGNFDGFPGNGTSFATPILAGVVACYWQAHKEYNNIKVLEMLKKDANNECAPNNSRGWGLPKLMPVKIELKSSAFLNTKNDHSGILVKFTSTTDSSKTDSTYTTANGSYSIALDKGFYKISFSKNYFFNVIYNDTIPILFNNCASVNSVTLSAFPSPPKVPFDFTAFADPNDLQMTILLTDAGYEYVTIEIVDFTGKTLLSGDVDPNNLSAKIDISSFADALYLVKVKTDKGTKVIKVLKF